MDDSRYAILEGTPSPERYYNLRKLANLTPPPLEAVPDALANSFASWVVFERKDMSDDTSPDLHQEPIGMARLVGDGALFLLVVDVAVHPDHQGRGIGKRLMETVISCIDERAPLAYVSLVADPPGQKLYPKFGFESVTKRGLEGMFRCPRIQEGRDNAKP
ncbi:acyl-CoA N-acyltransferase [Corynespora cassiicola Philippines]|uniref:Acyl-CoA N-acyltransferase n=1 Tax=Corynespora cassiicola Philippines TaxID=1448308 RepID=A0A2T2NXJ7_CORCC|nr:acyl-CoA N-acyltransferase [Corynespora cassiicola Philippines]